MVKWPPRFLFVSGRLCLDFAQTGGSRHPTKWERLHAPSDLVDWLATCSLGLRVQRVTQRELNEGRALREAIWTCAQAVRRKREPPMNAVRILNRLATKPDLAPVLQKGKQEWMRTATAMQALSTIARDAIDLFGGELKHRVRECRNPRCYLLFLDTSRPGKRAWCTMRRCGNLIKTARYRKSRKTQTEGARRTKRVSRR